MDTDNARTPRGLTASVLSLGGSLGRHAQSLAELASTEGKEALALYLRLAIMLGAAVVCLVFGYVLALLFVAFLAASLFGIAWIWITLVLCLLHLLVAFLCASHVRRCYRSPVFEATRSELKKDFETLKKS